MTENEVYEEFDTEDENPIDLSINDGKTGIDMMKEVEKEIVSPEKPTTCGGEDCEKMVTRPSGYCEECEKKYEPLLRATMLHCPSCPAYANCPYNKNELQICIYELQEDKRDMKDKDDVSDMMREVITMEKKMYDRYTRFVANTNPGQPGEFIAYSKELISWSKTMFEHIKHYATFMGWNKTRMDKEMLDAKIKAMRSVLGNKIKGYQYNADKLPNLEDGEMVKITIPENYDFDNEKEGDFQIPDVGELENKLEREDVTIDDDMLALEELEAEFTGDKEKEEEGDDSSDSHSI